MSTTTTVDCPSWCTSGTDARPCRGEHSNYRDAEYIPALIDLADIDWQRDASFPCVAVSATHDVLDGLDAGVSLHITGPRLDVQIGLRPREARALIEQMLATLALVEGIGKVTA